MAVYHYRRYILGSLEAAAAYITIWQHHVASLSALGIVTEGIFTVAESPYEVVALLRFPNGVDPEQAIRDYMASPGFLRDMVGFDMAQITRVDVQTLMPIDGSPLD